MIPSLLRIARGKTGKKTKTLKKHLSRKTNKKKKLEIFQMKYAKKNIKGEKMRQNFVFFPLYFPYIF